MTTATLQNSNTQTVHKAVKAAIKLQATTAAICGAALKRWSIVWAN